MNEAVPSIMIGAAALLIALLAVCVTAYVFLFSQLSNRVKEHGEERLPSERLQGRLGGALVALCGVTVLLAVLDMYYAATADPVWGLPYIYAEGSCYPAALFAASLADSIAMATFSVAIVKHPRLLSCIAEDMLEKRLEDAGYGSVKGNGSTSDQKARNAAAEDVGCGKREGQTMNAESGKTRLGVNPLHLIDIMSAITGVGDVMKSVGSRRGMVRTGRSKTVPGDTRERLERLVECRDLERVIGEYGVVKKEHSERIAEFARDAWRSIVLEGKSDAFLAYRSIEGISLALVDFSGADMSESRLVDCDFRDASFRGAKLERAEFRDCNLSGCDLRGASCGELAFADCVVEGIVFCCGTESGGKDAVLVDENTDLRGVSFRGSSLSAAAFGKEDIDGYDVKAAGVEMAKDAHVGSRSGDVPLFAMKWCGFQDARLRGASFRDVLLEESSWAGCEMSSSRMEGCACKSSSFERASFFDARILACDLRAIGCSDALFSRAVVEGVDFELASMRSSVFDNAILKKCSFSKAELSGASFTSGKFKGCDFRKAMGDRASFVGSSIESCRFDGALLLRGSLSRCAVRKSCFELAVLSDGAFVGAELRGCRFTYARLERVTAREALFARCVFVGANAKGADFTRSTINGCDFSAAALGDVNFSGARITDCSFAGASDVESIDFRGAFLTRVTFSGCDTSEMRRQLRCANKVWEVNVNGAVLYG